ncbi:LysR family transcriptional regulator [Cognatishimia activa]|uniref:LysR family transcriptional regulator n=1 Tax=Cognatishimia activa TaxID=1715691 RepID=UPI00222EA3C1|nr:LysR family transcriptional regulator [Cognatishimia activa]UZD91734.1 LysR family transcriptional regulator [Cognatishimia activa]
MLDQLRQIAIFAKAIEHGSFRGAASELRLSPSVVSHHIAQLEEKLGVALIYRSTRRLSLTRDGERLLASAQTMIAAVEEGLNAISGHSSEPSGELRVTISAVLSQSELIEKVSNFKELYPKVGVELDFSDERRDFIRDGIDLAIRTGPNRKRAANRKALFSSQRVAVATPDFLAKAPTISHPRDINQSTWIELTPARNVKMIFQKAGEADVQVTPKAYLSANDAYAVYQLARTGAGLAVVPNFLAQEDIAAGRVEVVLPDWKVEPLQTYAEWPSNAPKAGLARLLVEELAKQLPA